MPDPDTHVHPRIIAIANQKGGVGKTTTTINLAAGMAELGLNVLVVDLDPQGNASTGLGVGRNDRKLTSYDVLIEGVDPKSAIHQTSVSGLNLIPATTDLSSADIELVSNEQRVFLLRDALRQLSMEALGLDIILIDCPPSLNSLTVNGLVAADALIIPLQAEFFALEGLSQLMLTLREIRTDANPGLRIDGVLMTMSDGRNNLSKMVEADARDTLGDMVFKTVIPRNVRVSEAPSFSLPVIQYDPDSSGATAYRALARELCERTQLIIREAS